MNVMASDGNQRNVTSFTFVINYNISVALVLINSGVSLSLTSHQTYIHINLLISGVTKLNAKPVEGIEKREISRENTAIAEH